MQKDLNVLKNPLTLEEIKLKLEKDSTYVTGVVGNEKDPSLADVSF
jgi:hypothetical protein